MSLSYHPEGLRRQQRLLHGPTRRALVSLHRLPKECIFAVMGAAKSLSTSPHCSYHSLLSTAIQQGQAPQQMALGHFMPFAAATAPHQYQPQYQPPPGGGPASPQQPPPPAWVSFAHAFVALTSMKIRGEKSTDSNPSSFLFDPKAIHDLTLASAGSIGGIGGGLIATAFIGPRPNPHPNLTLSSLSSSLTTLKGSVNKGGFSLVHASPLALVIKCLEEFFWGFGPSAEPSLSPEGLLVIAQSYTKVWNIVWNNTLEQIAAKNSLPTFETPLSCHPTAFDCISNEYRTCPVR